MITGLMVVFWLLFELISGQYTYMITTIHPAVLESVEPTVKRRKPDDSRVDLPCPPCLTDYQSFMRGVDRADQRIGYYNLGRRSKKWWKRVFVYFIECCYPRAQASRVM